MRWPSAVNATGAAPCVVDVRLSLSTTGLFWVLRLAEAIPVWLSQSHWAIVDDLFYLTQADLVVELAGRPGEAFQDSQGRLGATLEAWREARSRFGLETRAGLYWPGDRLAEAIVPKSDDRDGDPGLIDRLDALAAGLDRRRRGGAALEHRVDALADCARDTLALAAALEGPRPIVLTTIAPDEAEPQLAGYLEMAGVPCCRLEQGLWAHRLEAVLAPVLARVGLAAP